MDDAAHVDRREHVGKRRHEFAHVTSRQTLCAREPRGKALTRDELHRDPWPLISEQAAVEHPGDAWMPKVVENRRLLDHSRIHPGAAA